MYKRYFKHWYKCPKCGHEKIDLYERQGQKGFCSACNQNGLEPTKVVSAEKSVLNQDSWS